MVAAAAAASGSSSASAARLSGAYSESRGVDDAARDMAVERGAAFRASC
eukprot:COSAG06_NODE_5393_length_3508_cov_29.096509_4_plen_49_part_00